MFVFIESQAYSSKFSSDRDYLVSTHGISGWATWDLVTMQKRSERNSSYMTLYSEFLHDTSEKFLTLSDKCRLWDINGEILQEYSPTTTNSRKLLLAEDNSSFVSITYGNTFNLTQIETGTTTSFQYLVADYDRIDENTLLCIGINEQIFIFDCRSGKIEQLFRTTELDLPIDGIFTIDIAPGKQTALSTYQNTFATWDLKTMRLIKSTKFTENYNVSKRKNLKHFHQTELLKLVSFCYLLARWKMDNFE